MAQNQRAAAAATTMPTTAPTAPATNHQQELAQSCDLAYEKIISEFENKSLSPIPLLHLIRIMEASQRINWQLIKYRSRLSRTWNHSVGLKRRIAEYQSKESIRDKRFSRGYTLDRLRDLKPSLVVHFYPAHFTINHCDGAMFPYDGSLIYQAILTQSLLPQVLDILDDANCSFYDGCIVVEVHDHRSPIRAASFANQTAPAVIQEFAAALPNHYEIHRVLLKPTPQTLLADLETMQQSHGLSSEQLLQIESKILLATEVDLCLKPSVDVGRISSILEYNRCKFDLDLKGRASKRNRSTVASKPVDTIVSPADLNQRLMMTEPKNRGTKGVHADFKRLYFVEDWRRNKLANDALPTIGLDQSRVAPQRDAKGVVRQMVRTIKFVKKITALKHDDSVSEAADKIIYSCLNIYMLMDGQHDAHLRWGSQPDTSQDGQSMRFFIGDAATTEAYVKTFVGLYGGCDGFQVVCDQRLAADQIALFQTQVAQYKNRLAAHKKRSTPNPVNTNSAAQQQHHHHQKAEASPGAPTPSIAGSPPPPQMSPVLQGNTAPVHQAKQRQTQAAYQQQQQQMMLANQMRKAQAQSQTQAAAQAQAQVLRGSPQVESPAVMAQSVVNMNAAVTPQMRAGQPGTSSPMVGQNVPPTGNNNAATLLQQSQARNNQEFLTQLLRLPFNQVPEEFKNLYLQVKQKVAALQLQSQQQAQMRQNQLIQLQQQQQQPGHVQQTQQQQQLQNQATSSQHQAVLQQFIQQQQTMQQALMSQNVQLQQTQQQQPQNMQHASQLRQNQMQLMAGQQRIQQLQSQQIFSQQQQQQQGQNSPFQAATPLQQAQQGLLRASSAGTLGQTTSANPQMNALQQQQLLNRIQQQNQMLNQNAQMNLLLRQQQRPPQ